MIPWSGPVSAETAFADALLRNGHATESTGGPATAALALDKHVREVLARVGTLSALGASALLPFNEVLAACGISRDVGERLRETGQIQPITVMDSGNPRLYVTLGAWRRFVEGRSVAPPPSKSALSRTIRKGRRDRL